MNHLLNNENALNYVLQKINQLNFFNSSTFEEHFTYTGDDLGATYTPSSTTFKLWAPLARSVTLTTYASGHHTSPLATFSMLSVAKGIWQFTLPGDLHGTYYTYTIQNPNGTFEVVDLYAKAVGVNGKRGMVVDFSRTNPPHWQEDTYVKLDTPTDAIIYELHVRDLSISSSSGITHKGKYLGFTELHTLNDCNELTGLSHLTELGITHVHLLPIYDFNSIDEAQLEKNCFNWGYDPLNYNALEGSYSTNPFEGATRIHEFKQLVQSLHNQNIGVIMDVVYNHTADSEYSYLHQSVPYYYHRCKEDGSFNDGSACGNEIASERSMVRKMIIDSVTFWAKEYHIDGFRFDLMGILDVETMNLIRVALDEINPDILMYGEGWIAEPTLLDPAKSALKINTPDLHPRIASFSDDMRDAIKGHVFYEEQKGFVNGNASLIDSVKFGVVAATNHPQVCYDAINYSSAPWATEPTQCITYASAHDNLTLFDKLQLTHPEAPIETLIQMNKMAATLVLTSQGIAFIHAGEELLRTKVNPDGTLEHNSYKSPDSVNGFDWMRKTTYKDVFNYYKGLIRLRRTHAAFRMSTTSHITKHLQFVDQKAFTVVETNRCLEENEVLGYFILDYPSDNWKEIGVFFNPSNQAVRITLPINHWVVVVNPDRAGTSMLETITDGELILPPNSHYVIVDAKSFHA